MIRRFIPRSLSLLAALAVLVACANPAPAVFATLSVAPTALAADGTSTAEIVVRTWDAPGVARTTGGADVRLDAPTLGSLGAVVDHGDGTYSATFTAGRAAGTATFAGTVNGTPIANEATLALTPWTFAAGRAIAATIGPADYYNRHWAAVDGDTALVPVAGDPASTLYTHVDAYERDEAGNWAWSASLVPFDGSYAFTDIGRIVQLSGDTAAVASVRNGVESVVHVFEHDAVGAWRERAVLLRGEGVGTAVSYSAGIAIALRDDVLVVGRPVQDGGSDEPARVYVRDHGGPSVWGLAAELPMSSGPIHRDGYLGTDVAVGAGGDVIAVAKSVQNNDGGLGSPEAVYVYERRAPGEDAWDLVRTLRYYDGELASGYSTYVEIDGSTLMVGHMPTVINPEVTVEFYERDAGGVGQWGLVAQREARLELLEGWITGYAHTSVRLVGDTAALGFTAVACGYVGPGETPPIPGCGAGQVHVYGRDVGGAGAWGELQVLRPPAPFEGQRFGTAIDVAADEATVVVATSPVGRVPGEADVFVFER